MGFAACGDDDDPADDTGTDETTQDTGADDTTADTESDDTVSGSTESDDTMTVDTESDDTGESSGTDVGQALEAARQQLIDAGLSEEDADCVIDEAVERGTGGETAPDMNQVMELLEGCGVDPSDLGS